MTDYEDYLEDFDYYFEGDYNSFNDEKEFIRYLLRNFKPLNFESWSNRSKKDFYKQASDYLESKKNPIIIPDVTTAPSSVTVVQSAEPLSLPRRRKINFVAKANNIYNKEGKEFRKGERVLLQKISVKVLKNEKLTKTENRERTRLVQLKAKQIRNEGNFDRKQSLKLAWKEFKRN